MRQGGGRTPYCGWTRCEPLDVDSFQHQVGGSGAGVQAIFEATERGDEGGGRPSVYWAFAGCRNATIFSEACSRYRKDVPYELMLIAQSRVPVTIGLASWATANTAHPSSISLQLRSPIASSLPSSCLFLFHRIAIIHALSLLLFTLSVIPNDHIIQGPADAPIVGRDQLFLILHPALLTPLRSR